MTKMFDCHFWRFVNLRFISSKCAFVRSKPKPPPPSKPARAECIGTQQQLLEQVRLLLFILWFDFYSRLPAKMIKKTEGNKLTDDDGLRPRRF